MNRPTDPQAAISDIARQLNESEPGAMGLIARIVQRLGTEQAYAFLDQTLTIEAEGGLLTMDGRRRRTVGGVYFFLVRGHVTAADHQFIWPEHAYPRQRQSPPRPTSPPAPPFQWEERVALLREAEEEKGSVTVKITLIGRPGKIIERQGLILTPVVGKPPPSLPKGLPSPPAEPTVYLVYIARKQWSKVAEAIQNPEDRLVIEGYPFHDPGLGVIGVFAQSATTVLLQQARRESSD